LPDLDVQYIERTPHYRWDQTKQWPSAGETVTFIWHIANRGGNSTGAFAYAWYLDGQLQSQPTHPGLAAGAEDVISLNWNWVDGSHTVKLVLDPGGALSEISKQNNVVEDRTNALILGIWVEQSFYDFFNANVWQSGWGGNSFDDWIQRHINIWNGMFAAAVYPLTPNGILDRVRLGKVVRVPDGGLNCQTNFPATDYETDFIWGFPSEQVGVPSPANCTWWTPRYRDDHSSWDRDMGLLHELSHARYLVDLYGFNIDSNEQRLSFAVGDSDQTLTLTNLPDIQQFRPPAYPIIDGEIIYCTAKSGNSFTNCSRGAQGTKARPHQADAIVYGEPIRLQDGLGNALVGSAGLPSTNGAFHRGTDFYLDLMNAGSQYGEHSAYAWNRIAGRRPVCGNYNAPCNIGEYLRDIPQSNVIEVRYPDASPVANALVEIYRAKPYPIWYGKTYEGVPDLVLYTDAQGRADLGALPFGSDGLVHTYGQSNGVLALKITAGNKVGVQFLEVTAFNLAYWRGNSQQAILPVTFSNWAILSGPTRTPTPTSTGTSTPTPTRTFTPTPTSTGTYTPTPTPTVTPTPVPGTWQRLDSRTNKWLWPIRFIDANLGWAGGEGGLILNTTNGGATWQSLSQSGPTVQDLHFVDGQYGWVVGWGYVGRTTDGGQTWTQQDYGANHNLLGVHFLDRQRGWIVGGEGGWIHRTTDSGQTWSVVQMPLPWAYLQSVAFVDSSRGWAVGWSGNILLSTDGGASWQRQVSGTGDILEGVFFADALEGWIVGHGGIILHTTDGGGNWRRQNSGTAETLYGVGFANRQIGWAVGEHGTILVTVDGGNIWQQEVSGVNTTLQQVAILDVEHVWTAGQAGVILKRTPGNLAPTPTPTNAHLWLPLILKNR
jgi:photosystem II stability/assembly factor-like uncharacterized protein